MEGTLDGAQLIHAAAVAHEAELWPRWLPFCSAAATLRALSPMERVTYIQFDLTPMMKRGATLHWSLSDSMLEQRSLLLLGASVGQTSPFEPPPSAAGIKLADFRAIKVLITPRTPTSVDIRWVTNVDLNAGSLPQALVSMVTKKVAGSIVTTLMREAQKISAVDADTPAGGAAAAAVAHDNPYLQRV